MNRSTLRARALHAPTALAALALAAALSPARADPLLLTDANWKVSIAAPTAGWNSDAGFDASSWQAATVLYNVATYLGPSYAAKGIWSSGGQFSTTETTIWARQIWNLATLPISAALQGGFDDDADLWVNGVQVISDHNGSANNVGPVNLLPYLMLGNNIIAFTASDNYPVWGYNHSAWVQIDGQPGVTVPEPATPALVLAGMAAMALGTARRRRKAR